MSVWWDHTLAVNLKAPFFLTRALAAGMRERGEGMVVNPGRPVGGCRPGGGTLRTPSRRPD